MALVSFLTPSGVHDSSMRPASSEVEGIVKLFGQLLTHMLLQQSVISICPKSRNLCSATSSGCSWTRIQLCSTPPVVVEVRCERLSQWAQNTFSGSTVMLSSQDLPETPS